MLEDLNKPIKTFSCKVSNIANTLDAKDKAIFLNAVNDLDWPVSALEQALRARGLQISASPIIAHRKKTCSCQR